MYDVVGFKSGRNPLPSVEMKEMGEVRGKTLLHLQCHFGLDTLSWARLGAIVTGLDFSGEAIQAAQKISEESGVPGRFIQSDLYTAESVLDEQFDIVYTGVGALCWLPDIQDWAKVVARFVKPTGIFYIHEFHPVLWSLDDERKDGGLCMAYPYFETSTPNRWVDNRTYTDGDVRLENAITYEWNHGLGEIITALITSGLRIEFLHEHRTAVIQILPGMIEVEEGWQLPEGTERVPLMYSIKASRPG